MICLNRLNLDEGAGAWCPVSAKPEADGHYEYLQINFRNISVVTAVSIQGRWYDGEGREFTRNFRLEYSRDDRWVRYRNMEQQQVSVKDILMIIRFLVLNKELTRVGFEPTTPG